MSVYSRGFQYNTCFGSTQFEQSNKGERLISIQHLFRFDNYRLGYAKKHRYISIQHLFRFDLSVHSVFWQSYPISIQHLFRFDRLHFDLHWKFLRISIQHLFRFDSALFKLSSLRTPDFNTTLVSVRHQRGFKEWLYSYKFQYNTCFGSTLSLHFC